MTKQLADRLHGIIPPVVTPLNDDRTFDRESAEKLYRYMIDVGSHGLFLFGSSGEGPLVSGSDRAAAIGIAIEVVQSRIPVLAGVLEPATDRVIEQAKTAKDLGADAIVVCPPFYYPSSQQDVLEHYRAIQSAVDLPILAYDIPATTKIKLELETILQLAREETIVGIKDSSGDSVNFRRLLVKRPRGLKVFTGADLLVDSVLLQGADGSVPGFANVAPAAFTQLYNHWIAGQQSEAVQLQNRLARLFDIFILPDGTRNIGYIIGVMKTALKLRGVIKSNRTFRPACEITPEQEERIRASLVESELL